MNTKELKLRYETIKSHLNEKTKRLWSWNEALALWHWWVSFVSVVTWISRTTIIKWVKEIKWEKEVTDIDRVRRTWWWRKKLEDKNTELKTDLEDLLESSTRWDPESPLKWCSKSTRNLCDELNNKNHVIGRTSVSRLLRDMEYNLQALKKTDEWAKNNPDRNTQFEYINSKTKLFQKQNQPVISVDTKKKENIWNYKNEWREYHKKWQAPEVKVYDFIDKKLWKVAPYWVYDIANNKWWVNVGISWDTAQFAVESIRQWYHKMWKNAYPKARKIFINADWWWSNWHRVKLWKIELQKLANELDLTIHVSHFPPWTSKWNKIEHRMFSFITKNWRWKSLVDRMTVINLIGSTKTKQWLEIKARLDERIYKTWIKVSDNELKKWTWKNIHFIENGTTQFILKMIRLFLVGHLVPCKKY